MMIWIASAVIGGLLGITDLNPACQFIKTPDLPPSGQGYDFIYGYAWEEWDLNQDNTADLRREYRIVGTDAKGRPKVTPMPSFYWYDFNQNHVFELPGEVWFDREGNGRCEDLDLAQPPESEALAHAPRNPKRDL